MISLTHFPSLNDFRLVSLLLDHLQSLLQGHLPSLLLLDIQTEIPAAQSQDPVVEHIRKLRQGTSCRSHESTEV